MRLASSDNEKGTQESKLKTTLSQDWEKLTPINSPPDPKAIREMVKAAEAFYRGNYFKDAVKEAELLWKNVVKEGLKNLESSLNNTFLAGRKAINVAFTETIQEVLSSLPAKEEIQKILKDVEQWQEYRDFQEQLESVRQPEESPVPKTSIINGRLVLSGSISMATCEATGYHTPAPAAVAIEQQEQLQEISQTLSTLLSKVEKLKSPAVTQIIIVLLCGLFFAYFNSYAAHQVNNLLDKNEKKQLSKQITRNATNLPIPRSVLNEFRQVDADTLNVRKHPNTSGEIIGKLYFGQTVQLLEKGRKWTRVSWESGNGECFIEGWVFNRYLKQFK